MLLLSSQCVDNFSKFLMSFSCLISYVIFISYLLISSIIILCVFFFCSMYFLPNITLLHLFGSVLLSLLYFFLMLICLLIFSQNQGFSSSPVIFENRLMIVLTIHCCFVSFIISSDCSKVVS